MHRMTLHEAQQNFDALPTVVLEGPVVVTRRGKPVLVAMAHSHFDSLMETLDVLSNLGNAAGTALDVALRARQHGCGQRLVRLQ